MKFQSVCSFQYTTNKKDSAPVEVLESPDDILQINEDFYPFATVLRLRVLQIVCGISSLVMGTVAFIEERGELNLGLGIPAGGATVLAAAASIHTSRGFGGYRPSSCMPGSSLRFLGPSVKVAVLLSILWGISCSFLIALTVESFWLLVTSPEILPPEVAGIANDTDLVVIAAIELGLAVVTLLAVALLLRIDCKYDPD